MKKKIKVLITSPYGPELLNGVSVYIKKLSLSLKKKKFSVDILSFRNDLKKPAYTVLKGIRIFYYPIKNIHFFLTHYYYTIYSTIFLIRYGSRYDIIHSHTSSTTVSLISTIYAKFKKKRSILTLHGNRKIFFEEGRIKGIIEKYTRLFLGKIVINLTNALISVSKSDLLEVNKYFRCNRREHSYYIPNGLLLNETDFPIEERNRKFITFIGNLSFYKGFDIFLNLAELLYKYNSKLIFLIIGKPSERNRILYRKLLIKKQKINIIHIEETENIKNYLLQSKIYILSSRSEGMSTTLLEAMNYFTPVIATDINSNSNIIKDGVNGFLLNPNNLEDGFEKIKNLLTNNDLNNRITKNAWNTLIINHNWIRIANNNIKVYKKLLEF